MKNIDGEKITTHHIKKDFFTFACKHCKHPNVVSRVNKRQILYSFPCLNDQCEAYHFIHWPAPEKVV